MFIIFANELMIVWMPRIKSPRKVSTLPKVKGFRPFGQELDAEQAPIFLHIEEFEAFRLCDYERKNHHEAAALMQISRPTFTRIYALARTKIATAFSEGRSIEIEGGKVYFDSRWHTCESCGCYFNQIENQQIVTLCPLCGSDSVAAFVQESESNDSNNCYCMECGFEKQNTQNVPCSNDYCPDCHPI